MKNIKIELTNERIIPASGLAVVGAILGKSGFVKRCNRMDVTKNRSQHKIKNGDILLDYIGLLAMGKPAYESAHGFDDDQEFYQYALGITRSIPSEETLRQRMDDIGASLRSQILSENVEVPKSNGIVPGKLPNGYVPADIDVTPFDNSKTQKQCVSRTYKGCDGYAPTMACIGAEGYPINRELREGKRHCQKHTPEFLRETIRLCRKITDGPLLVRLFLTKCAYKKTVEKARGKTEKREYWQTEDITWLSQGKEWEGLKTIILTHNTVTGAEGEVSIEERYFISSLPLGIEDVVRAVRGHWMVESYHWHLDVTFREDGNRTLKKQAAYNLNIMRKLSLNILKLIEVGNKPLSMKKKRYAISTNPEKHLEQIMNL